MKNKNYRGFARMSADHKNSLAFNPLRIRVFRGRTDSGFVLPVVVVSVMAARAGIFQFAAGILRLAAVVTMFAFRIAQFVLCLVDALFALPVIAIICLRWNRPRDK
jgi:hypothetical protein